jgi:dTDP-4-amino-4,6-dideoxygalactose transaminase
MGSYLKESVNDLALFSKEPAFQEKLHVGRPNVGDRKQFMKMVEDMLDRRWFSNDGPYVQELEKRLSHYLGVKHCIAVCNATIALEITARALNLTGEVIVPSFTFVASAHSLQWQQIKPVFCDINPQTHCLDVESVRKRITDKTTGIMGVHVWGQPCEIEALTALAKEHNLKLIFDAAHAFGCSFNGKMLGNFGNAEVFSFHATKFFNSFEGGAIATNDDELGHKIRLMKNFGFSGVDTVIHPGTNGKMTEVSAAMALTSLDAVDSFIDINKKNHACYARELDGLPGVRVLPYDDSERCNYQYIIVEVDEEKAGISRDLLVQILHAENVLARKYFYPGVHQMEPYRTTDPEARRHLPQTEILCRKVMSLPNGTTVNNEHIGAISQIIKICLANASSLHSLLNGSVNCNRVIEPLAPQLR